MARQRKSQTAIPSFRLILDSGAVIALARQEPRARAALAAAVRAGAEVEVPPEVVAETVRGDGPRDAPVNRVIRAVGEVPASEEAHARLAGRLLAKARSNATVDAMVVAHAIRSGGGVVLTGDPDDLGRLAAAHPEVVIEPV